MIAALTAHFDLRQPDVRISRGFQDDPKELISEHML